MAQYTVGPDVVPLIIEPGEPYSCVWPTEVSLDEFQEEIDQYASSTATTILYTEENPRNESYRYGEAKEILEDEVPRFFRVNTEKFDITWERKRKSGEMFIGFIADDAYPDSIRDLYEETTGVELGDDDLTELDEHLR